MNNIAKKKRTFFKESKKNHLCTIFHSTTLLLRVLNKLTKNGKKGQASKILSSVVRNIKSTNIIYNAIQTAQPVVEVRNVRVSRMTRQIPIGVPFNRQEGIAIRWLVDMAKNQKKNRSNQIHNILSNEIIDASNSKGSLVSRRNDLYKLADINRVFAKPRWW